MLETILKAPALTAEGDVTLARTDLCIGGDRLSLWARVRGAEVSPRADAWAAAALLPAMRVGRPLRVEGELSPQLLKRLDEIQEIFHAWLPELRPVEVRADALSAPVEAAGRGTGSFFSAGLDSFYTAIRNERIGHLVHVLGFDIWAQEAEFGARVRREIRGVAGQLDTHLIEVDTNLHEIGDPFVSWEFYHGSAVACVGLLLSPTLSEVLIPATGTWDALAPWGSHPVVDPLWSTEATRFVHEGVARRMAKAAEIARCDAALATLRVCLDRTGDRYNCGTCEKCTRTMVQLEAIGALERCKTLPDRLDVEAIRRLDVPSQTTLDRWEETLQDLEARDGDATLIGAVRVLVRRNRMHFLRRRIANLIGRDFPLRRTLVRLLLKPVSR